MEGWARFEQRARERRIEKRLAAAHAALHSRRFADCRAALSELTELSPGHPDIERLTLQLSRAETGHPRRGGALVVAAAAFAAVVLTSQWVANSNRSQPKPIVETAAPAPAAATTLLAARDVTVDLPMAIIGEPETVLDDVIVEPPPPAVPVAPSVTPEGPTASVSRAPVPAPAVRPSEPPVPAPPVRPSEPPVPVPAAVATELNLPASSALEPIAVPPPLPPQRVAPTSPPLATPTTPAAAPADAVPAAPVVDDADRIRSVVQKYRAAYDSLDAGLVQEVWPTVNEAALARAFEGLQSQTLTFRACDVQLRGSAATVLCTGSTRYIPKIGSREPRVEPLAWTFTLRKRANNEWQIESARAVR